MSNDEQTAAPGTLTNADRARPGADEAAGRPVVLHYHIFKNAGTSIDSMFREALGDDRCDTAEFGGTPAHKRETAAAWLGGNSRADYFSSHTALLPVPDIAGVSILPVLFLRHPIDRIASAYRFESRQDVSTFGATLARNTTFAGYVETRLAHGSDKQCRNFQAHKLAEGVPYSKGDLAARAGHGLAQLPFVGTVENFDDCVQALSHAVSAHGLGELALVSRRQNASSSTSRSLHRRLEAVRKDLGGELYQALQEANRIDLDLHERALEAGPALRSAA